ncbi:MAG: N-acetylmuramoyl-L-alanine amidase [Ruminococcaceae bacterium]|nr:N-acetylmuramoyl-L-alanine amidase [Oscillospiraceae bacterium]
MNNEQRQERHKQKTHCRKAKRKQRQTLNLLALTIVLVLVTAAVALVTKPNLVEAVKDKLPGWLQATGRTGNSLPGKNKQGTIKVKADDLVVILDPGHGGSDTGAQAKDSTGRTINEADFNLALSKQVKEHLKKLGIEVLMTRQDASWVSLYNRISQAGIASLDKLALDRPEILPAAKQLTALRAALQEPIRINSDTRTSGGLGFMGGYGVGILQADLLDLQRQCVNVLYVSIHANSSTNSDLHGTQVYYIDDNTVELSESEPLATQTDPAGHRIYRGRDNERNRKLAVAVYDSIVSAVPKLGGTNAGKAVLTGNYAVLREQALASIMVETGFLSNSEDLKFLLAKNNQAELAEAIAKGIENYAKSN